MLGLDDAARLAHAMEDVLAKRTRRRRASRTSSSTRCFARPTRCAATSPATARPTPDLLDELAASRAGDRSPATSRRRPGRRPPSRQPLPRRRRAARDPGSAEKIDRLLDLVGETVLHRRRLEHVLGERARRATTRRVSDELDLGERLLDELKDAAIEMRTLPLATITAPLPRAVRDIAAAEGKEVELVIERRRHRARPRHPREPLRAARPPAPQRGRARDRVAERARARGQAGARDGRAARRAARRHGRDRRLRRRPRRVAEASSQKPRGTARSPTCSPDAGFSTADEVTRALRPRRRPRRGEAPRRGRSAARSRCAASPGTGTRDRARASARPRAARRAARRARRTGLTACRSRASRRRSRSEDLLTLEGRPALELRGRSVPLADLAELDRRRGRRARRRIARDRRHGRRAGASRRPATACSARRRSSSSRSARCSPRSAATSARRSSATAASRCCSIPTALDARATHARQARRRRRAGAREAACAEGARRRGLVHRARAPAQHPRGRRLPRRDGARRQRGASTASRPTTRSTSSSPTSRCRRWTGSS